MNDVRQWLNGLDEALHDLVVARLIPNSSAIAASKG